MWDGEGEVWGLVLAMVEKCPTAARLLSAPLISESTLGIDTRPPDPFSVQADERVMPLVVISTLPPAITDVAAMYALRVGPMCTVAVGSETSIPEPPPPVAVASVEPLPVDGCDARSEFPAMSSRSL